MKQSTYIKSPRWRNHGVELCTSRYEFSPLFWPIQAVSIYSFYFLFTRLFISLWEGERWDFRFVAFFVMPLFVFFSLSRSLVLRNFCCFFPPSFIFLFSFSLSVDSNSSCYFIGFIKPRILSSRTLLNRLGCLFYYFLFRYHLICSDEKALPRENQASKKTDVFYVFFAFHCFVICLVCFFQVMLVLVCCYRACLFARQHFPICVSSISFLNSFFFLFFLLNFESLMHNRIF